PSGQDTRPWGRGASMAQGLRCAATHSLPNLRFAQDTRPWGRGASMAQPARCAGPATIEGGGEAGASLTLFIPLSYRHSERSEESLVHPLWRQRFFATLRMTWWGTG